MVYDHKLTVNVALFALIMGAEAIARYIKVMVDTARTDKAQILHRLAFVKASFFDVLMFGGDERCDG